MILKNVGFALVALVVSTGGTTDPVPQTEISNGLVRARLYLPDTEKGYYRGSRFDWSGVIAELEHDGHSYFGQWFPEYSPTLHDAIMGPVDAFSPIGYDDARTDETFLIVGVGVVRKPEESKYSIATPYPIVNSGKWSTKSKSDRVEFAHVLKDDQYSYEYKKVVGLLKGKTEMVLSYSLKNTGKNAIDCNVYNHNFFVMDNQPTGPGFMIEFPFKPEGDAGRTAANGGIDGKRIVYNRQLAAREYLHFPQLTGFGNTKADYNIKIENHNTGAAVEINGDKPLSKLAFWSAEKTVCPEPFIHINVAPGQTFEWSINYRFYTCETTSK
jgi:hypothetical protein